jgi:hypothetical protein
MNFLIKKVGINSNDPGIRNLAVHKLINNSEDPSKTVMLYCSRALRDFNINDFNEDAKKKILLTLQVDKQRRNNFILLGAYVGIDELEKYLLSELQQASLSQKDKWTIFLALARLGNKKGIDNCLATAKKMPVNDDYIYVLVPDLIYTRQNEIFDHLFTLILSEEKNCLPANPDLTKPIYCGYRIMEMIGPYVKNYPLALEASGDIATDNYENALETLREWIKANREEIVLNKDIY